MATPQGPFSRADAAHPAGEAIAGLPLPPTLKPPESGVESPAESEGALIAEGFRHPPFPKAGTLRVRYRAAEPLKPRRIEVEDAS
jgi:hypothetical protein